VPPEEQLTSVQVQSGDPKLTSQNQEQTTPKQPPRLELQQTLDQQQRERQGTKQQPQQSVGLPTPVTNQQSKTIQPPQQAFALERHHSAPLQQQQQQPLASSQQQQPSLLTQSKKQKIVVQHHSSLSGGAFRCFHQCSTSSFFSRRFQKLKKTVKLSVFWHFWDLRT